MTLKTPLEREEQARLVAWLASRGYRYMHVPSSFFGKRTPAFWGMLQALKNAGWVPGFPDLIIVLKRRSVAFLEIKRIGERVEPGSEQAAWIDVLRWANAPAGWAAGCDAAINQILRWEAGDMEVV